MGVCKFTVSPVLNVKITEPMKGTFGMETRFSTDFYLISCVFIYE